MKYDAKRRHRRSIRLHEYDYSSPGAYFITICAHNRSCLFGEVRDGRMHRNHCGELVQEEWFRSARIRKEIRLDAWMVMPNHVHGIVIIEPAGAHGHVPLQPVQDGHAPRRIPQRRPRSLATFVGGFKGAVNIRINEMRRTPGAPVWQENYYEHIIRNEDEMNRVREYILTNPLRWTFDREHPERQPTDSSGDNPDWYV